MSIVRGVGGSVLVMAAAVGASGVASAEEAPAPSPPPLPPPALSVTAKGFRSTKGQALVAVYDSGERWLKIDKAVRLVRARVEGNKVEVQIQGLPPGVYGVSVIHDENTNGKLDMHWFPIPGPDEGAGVSNDATASLGPPKWSDARFRLTERGGTILVNLRY